MGNQKAVMNLRTKEEMQDEGVNQRRSYSVRTLMSEQVIKMADSAARYVRGFNEKLPVDRISCFVKKCVIKRRSVFSCG